MGDNKTKGSQGSQEALHPVVQRKKPRARTGARPAQEHTAGGGNTRELELWCFAT